MVFAIARALRPIVFAPAGRYFRAGRRSEINAATLSCVIAGVRAAAAVGDKELIDYFDRPRTNIFLH